jgi:hypothetical protein
VLHHGVLLLLLLLLPQRLQVHQQACRTAVV